MTTATHSPASFVALPEGYRWDARFELGLESHELSAQVWPVYLSSSSDRPQKGLELEISLEEFHRRYPAWGVRDIASGRLAAYANAVLVECDLAQKNLPDEGWQFAIEAGAKAKTPNCLCLVIATVDPTIRGRGLAAALIDYAKQVTLAQGLSTLIAPVRPSRKSDFRDMPIDHYASLRRDDGQLQDPWLRAHERAGGKMLNVCHRSALVEASVPLWRKWTALELAQSGTYALPEGLAPLAVDLENGIGTYTEPNVWFRYDLKK